MGIGECGKEPMSLFLEMASARYMPHFFFFFFFGEILSG